MNCAIGATEALASLAASLAIVVMLTGVSEALVEWLIVPAWEKAGLDKFYLRYIGAAAAFGVVFISGQNLLADYLPANLFVVGRVLTALLAGRGSNWLHDFFSNRRKEVELKKARLARLLQLMRERA